MELTRWVFDADFDSRSRVNVRERIRISVFCLYFLDSVNRQMGKTYERNTLLIALQPLNVLIPSSY